MTLKERVFRIAAFLGVILLFLVPAALAPLTPAHAVPTSYYLDCSAAQNGSGSSTSPWNTLASVNGHGSFGPGDSILLKRGTTCPGSLVPQGSGSGSSAGTFITIGAYGSGARPIVDAGSNEEAIKLFNQQYWHITNIETRGGTSSGIYIGGDTSGPTTLSHFRLTNDVVHGVTGGARIGTDPAGNALVCLCAGYYTSPTTFNPQLADVRLDGLFVFDGKAADGIYGGAQGLTIQNSTVHDVGWSGIWSGYSSTVTIQRNSVYNVGSNPSSAGVIGIWTWSCSGCAIQHNRVWHVSSGDLADGGAFDIDWGSHDTVVQYNYAHDVDGYCVSVFGAGDASTGGLATTNSIIRYNVCSNTGQGPAAHPGYNPEGSIYLETWNGGTLDGVQIYNNTFYANPAASTPVLHEVPDTSSVAYTGTRPNLFENNLIYSSIPPMVATTAPSTMRINRNLYFDANNPNGSSTTWKDRGTPYTGFGNWQAGSGQDGNSRYAPPRLPNPTYHALNRPTTQLIPMSGSPAIGHGVNVCAGVTPSCSMGSVDFLGHAARVQGRYDIGAIETQ